MEEKRSPIWLMKVLDILTALLKAGLGVFILVVIDYEVAIVMMLSGMDYDVYNGVFAFAANALAIIALMVFSRVEAKFTNDTSKGLIRHCRIGMMDILSTFTIAFALLALVTTYLLVVNTIGAASEVVSREVTKYSESMKLYDEEIPAPLWDQLLYVVSVTVFVPMAEEFAFRGIVYGSVRRVLNSAWAIVISAVVFGFMHGHSVQSGYALISGFILGLAYYAYDSIIASILIHGIFNFLGTGVYYLYDALGVGRDKVMGLYTIQFALLLPAGMLLAHKANQRYKANKALALEAEQQEQDPSQALLTGDTYEQA